MFEVISYKNLKKLDMLTRIIYNFIMTEIFDYEFITFACSCGPVAYTIIFLKSLRKCVQKY